jgi:hypothetical protein
VQHRRAEVQKLQKTDGRSPILQDGTFYFGNANRVVSVFF